MVCCFSRRDGSVGSRTARDEGPTGRSYRASSRPRRSSTRIMTSLRVTDGNVAANPDHVQIVLL
jgi:hypothetical protein